MSDDYLFTHDGAVSAYDDVETDGITIDDDGGASFDWNEIPVVELDEPPHATAFDTDEFYKIEGATVARPIKQPYRVGDSIETYKKPADELREAAWSADNKPYPLTHPDTGMVKATEDIHGFWKKPRYDDDTDRLKSDLYVPTNDDEAREFIENYQDVSIGFYNRVHDSYDGDTGSLTDDDVDGYQTDLYIDHIAGVKRGRCSSEEGCGLDHDGSDHGKVVLETESPQMGQDEADSVDSGDGDADDDSATSQTREGADTSGDESDAGAETEPSAEEACAPCTSNMGDSNDNTDNFDIQVDLNDLTVDSLAEQFDAVADLREERDAMAETVSEIREELDNHGIDVEDDECPCEAVDDVLHDYDEMEDTVEDLREELDSYREEEKEEALDELSELGADRDAWADEDLDEIREEIDRREEVLSDLDVDTKGAEPEESTDSEDDDTETTYSGKRTFGRGHAAGPQA